MMTLHHRNDRPVAKLYCDTDFENRSLQGGIVTFNLLRSTGEYVGYTEVAHMAALFRIHLRTGCFCNPGSCQRHLVMTNEDVMKNYDAGYTCGGSKDLIDGKPTGAVRISFGYMSTPEDVEAVLLMIRKCFLDGPEIVRVPGWFDEVGAVQKIKYYRRSAATFENNAIYRNYDFAATKNRSNNEVSNGRYTSGIGTCSAARCQENASDSEKVKLARLFIYPIKSCAAYEITDSWLLGNRGLQYDREWMIVTSAGVCLSQKQLVNLCMLTPKICKKDNTLTLSYPGKDNFIKLSF